MQSFLTGCFFWDLWSLSTELVDQGGISQIMLYSDSQERAHCFSLCSDFFPSIWPIS